MVRHAPLAQLLVAVVALLVISLPLPSRAAVTEVRLYELEIAANGNLDPASLERTVRAIRLDQPEGPRQIVAFIHGYAAPPAAAREEYRTLAGRLAGVLGAAAERTAMVGIHWPSSPGPTAVWLPRAFEHRLLKPFGLGDRVRDPYATTVWRAHGSGRRGLRAALFGLRDAFPGTALHLVTHSLGADLALNALAPDLTRDKRDAGPPFAPERELRVDGLFLAGADVDSRLFVDGDQAPAARAALPRARLWWFIVPRAGGEDRVLQVRKLDVGRRALGNTGPRFFAADADRLLAERRLVLDLGGVPRLHSFVDYYGTPRLAEIAAAMGRLSGLGPGVAEAVAGAREVLDGSGKVTKDGDAGTPRAVPGDCVGALDSLLAAPSGRAALTPYLSSALPTVRIYAAWRLAGESGGGGEIFGRQFTVRGALRAAAAGAKVREVAGARPGKEAPPGGLEPPT